MPSYLPDQADFTAIRRVLVIKLQHLGDVLLTAPVFSLLKQRYPHLQIDALVFADTAVMLNGNPDVNEIFSLQRRSSALKRQLPSAKLLLEWRLLRALRKRRYDLVIALTDRMRAVWLTRLLRPRYSVAQYYSHKRGALWRSSFSHLYAVPATPRHSAEIHLDALRRLGIYPREAEKRLRFEVIPESAEKAANMLAGKGLHGKDYVLVHPTSRWMFKSWNPAAFAEVIRAVAASGIPVVIASGPDRSEREYARTILENCNEGIVDFSGQLTLPELAFVISQARCFIGLDSVAMHLAAAVGTPCIAIFGPSDERRWGPWQVPHRIITSGHTCRPCNLDGCGNGKVSDCLQALDPATVVSALREILTDNQA